MLISCAGRDADGNARPSTSGEVLMTPGGAPSELSVLSKPMGDSSFVHSAPADPSSTWTMTIHFGGDVRAIVVAHVLQRFSKQRAAAKRVDVLRHTTKVIVV
jgi:hypothetical protein